MPRANTGYTLKKYKDAGETWNISWSEKGRTRRRSTGTTDRSEAELVLAAFIQSANGQGVTAQAPSNDSLKHIDVILDLYANEHVEGVHSNGTPYVEDKSRAYSAIKFLKQFFAGVPIQSIEQEHVKKYCAWRKKNAPMHRKPKDPTLRRDLIVLIAAANHARKNKKYPVYHDDVPTVKLPKEGKRRDRWLSYEEIDKLLAACWYEPGRLPNGRNGYIKTDYQTRLYVFVMIGLETAARKTAIEHLKKKQVDLKLGVINLLPEEKEQTNKIMPVVPISDDLRPVLEKAMKESKTEYVLGSTSSLYIQFKAAVKRAGLSSDVTPHIMRHTWITLAAQAGISFWDISGVTGDDEATLKKNYAKHSPDFLRSAINFKRER